MTDYEKLRLMRIQENRSRLKDLGVKSMAYEVSQFMKRPKQANKSKMHSMKMVKDTDEYRPGEEGELNYSSEEDENEIMINNLNLRSRSKKVSGSRGKSPTKIKETANISSLPMADLVKTCPPNTKKQHLN